MQDKQKKEQVECVRISRSDAGSFLKQYHYLGSVPGGNESYALLIGGEVLAIVCVLRVGKTVEMTRFMLTKNEKNLASRLLAVFLKYIRESGAEKMVTFADPNVGHTGAIYKAVGGNCVGQGKDMVGFKLEDGSVISGRNMSYALLGKEKGAVPVRLKGKIKFIFDL